MKGNLTIEVIRKHVNRCECMDDRGDCTPCTMLRFLLAENDRLRARYAAPEAPAQETPCS